MTITTVERPIIDRILEESRTSPRKRSLHLKRSSDGGNTPAIMYNALQPGTYIRPHQHPISDGKELWIPQQGAITGIIFDNKGNILEKKLVSPRHCAYFEIPFGTYHMGLVEEPDTLLCELYQGVFNPLTYKHFATWAPQETDNPHTVNVFLQKMRDSVNND